MTAHPEFAANLDGKPDLVVGTEGMDGDGKMELLVCRGGVQLLHNRGDGTFEKGPLLSR